MVDVLVQDTGTWEKTLLITVPVEKVSLEYGRLLDRMRREVKLPGFRPGKVPRDVIERRFGDSLGSELVERLVPAALEEGIREAGLRPVGEPLIHDLKFAPSAPMSFRAVLEIWPEIKVTGYDGLEIELEVEAVTADHVAKALERIRRGRAEEIPVDRPSIAGDLVDGSLEPVDVHGKRLQNLDKQEVVLEAGGQQLLPEFREASLGIAAGGERSLEVQYPEDFDEESLRGRKRRYRLTVREIREKKLKPLDDDFAREVDPDLDLEGLKGRIREGLEREVQRRAGERLEEMIIDRLIQLNTFSLPHGMVRRGVEAVQSRMAAEGDAPDGAEMATRLRPLVERTQRRQIILTAVAEAEGITVGDEEVAGRIEAIAARGRIHPAKLRKAMEARGDLDRLRDDLLERRTLDLLVEKAKVHQYATTGPGGDRVSKGGIILP